LNLTPRRRPQPALVVSLAALFVALGGTSYAAIAVTGANVKNGSLSGADIRNGSLRGTDVRNGSLTAGDLTANTIASLRGAAGATGATGATGTTGKTGAAGTFGDVTVRSVIYSTGPSAIASCESGEVATGGGVATSNNSSFVRLSAPYPPVDTPTGWQGQVVNTANAAAPGLVFVVCAKR
jgi:hypothetical protein